MIKPWMFKKRIVAITIGATGSDLGNTAGIGGNTILDKTNPASDSGAITSFQVFSAIEDMTACKLGTFYGSALSWTNRAFANVGTVTMGTTQTFSGLNVAVSINDIIGIYFTSDNLDLSFSGGSGIMYVAGDKFGGGSNTYVLTFPTGQMSAYGTGST